MESQAARIILRDTRVLAARPECARIQNRRWNGNARGSPIARQRHGRISNLGLEVSGAAKKPKINEDRKREDHFGAIAERKSETDSCQKRSGPNESEIKRCRLSQERETECDLPGAAETKVAPGPCSKNREEREENSPAERVRFDAGQLEEKVNTRPRDDSGQNESRKFVD